MELSKNWVGEKTFFDGKECKKVDAYFFITKDYDLYVFDGADINKKCKNAFKNFVEKYKTTNNQKPIVGNRFGEVRVCQKRNKQDTKKRCLYKNNKKLLYFCSPEHMKLYKGMKKISLKS